MTTKDQLKGIVKSVHKSEKHVFSKNRFSSIFLVEGNGVDGDCHYGKKIQHLSRMAVDPTKPNLRQVHLIHSELLDRLEKNGYLIEPGDLGENIHTANLDLLSLPTGTRLKIGNEAVLKITGLRNPCKQIEKFCPGLLKKLVYKKGHSEIIRLAGVMSIVIGSGLVKDGDIIKVEFPPKPHTRLDRV